MNGPGRLNGGGPISSACTEGDFTYNSNYNSTTKATVNTNTNIDIRLIPLIQEVARKGGRLKIAHALAAQLDGATAGGLRHALAFRLSEGRFGCGSEQESDPNVAGILAARYGQGSAPMNRLGPHAWFAFYVSRLMGVSLLLPR